MLDQEKTMAGVAGVAVTWGTSPSFVYLPRIHLHSVQDCVPLEKEVKGVEDAIAFLQEIREGEQFLDIAKEVLKAQEFYENFRSSFEDEEQTEEKEKRKNGGAVAAMLYLPEEGEIAILEQQGDEQLPEQKEKNQNQGKLDVVKQEVTRLNIDILEINELKWTGMGEFNSDDHQVYYCRQESLRRNGVAFIVNKRVRKAVLGYNLQNDRMILVLIQGKPFNILVVQVYAQATGAEKAEVNRYYEGLQHLLELTPKNDVRIITGNWNAKVGSQR
ncbi:Craniofacial development protein 2 [Varanus komodoensis]|nr:Craniofacial development protein 2 [Varanus komodoensis]